MRSPRAHAPQTTIVAAALIHAFSMGCAMAKVSLSDERVKSVAKMLPAKPSGLGKPITDREAWKALGEHPSFQRMVASAEKLLKSPLPEQPDELYLDFSRTGNRTRWQRVASRRRKRIPTFVLAECVENKGRFLPALEEVLRAVCAERTWIMPAHDRTLRNFKGKAIDIDLASSAMGWTMATSLHLLGDKLSADVRAMIRENVRRRILDPFRDMITGKRKENWWMLGTNNWNAVCLAGVTGAALAQLPSREERALVIVGAEKYVRNFLRGFTKDGYCSEGVGYWNYGFGHYVLLSELVHQATDGGVDLLARPEAREPALYGARIEIKSGVYPAFADCSVTARPDPQLMHFISRRFGLGLKRWEKKDLISASGRLFEAMLYSFPNSASQKPPTSESADLVGLRTWFEKAGVLICRPADSRTCRLAVAMKGGNNAEHHNHNDVGSYIAVVGDRAVAVDPGAEVYTRRTFSSRRYESNVLNSYGHPVPVIAGKLQRTGRTAQGRVLDTRFSDASDTLVLEMASAYKVPELTSLKRTFVYSRDGAGSLTVTDEMEASTATTFETALVTLGKWKKTGPNTLRIYQGDEALRAEIDTGGSEFEITAEQIKEDVRTKTLPTRIALRLTKPAKNARVRITYRAVSKSGK